VSTSPLSARVLAIPESPTLAVSAKAKALKAAGEPVVGFGAGEPDFPTPANIVEAARRAASDPTNHRYSPAAGLPALRQAIADKTRRDSGYAVGPEQVVVSNGGKHALYNVFQALLDPGDEVIVPAPYWVSYPEMVRLAEGVPVAVETTAASGFRASVDQLEAARTDRTKAVVFVSPSNPTGAVYPREDAEAIARWAVEHGLWVITDEIYEHLVYGDAEAPSLPVLVPELAERCVVVNGVAKTYAMTGWRVGWSVAPPEVAKGIATLQSQSTSNVCNVAQAAALEAITGPQDADTLALADLLLERSKVALVPGEAFGAPGHARLSYALADHDLEEGITRIGALLA
jgi:aspartate aminotransferase